MAWQRLHKQLFNGRLFGCECAGSGDSISARAEEEGWRDEHPSSSAPELDGPVWRRG